MGDALQRAALHDPIGACLRPDWPAPEHVRSLMSTRIGGVSQPPYDSFNLGAHCADDARAVAANRRRLDAALPHAPRWLRQVHGTTVVLADALHDEVHADASVSRTPGTVCAVLVADCLPVLLCSRQGDEVAAAHAGWRGLASGVLESTLAAMRTPAEQLIAWLGPCIGPQAFQVGPEVRAAYVDRHPDDATAFRPDDGDRYLCDLAALARARLSRLGVPSIHGGHWCTVADPHRFYSYRRDGSCGRMAALIWIAAKD